MADPVQAAIDRFGLQVTAMQPVTESYSSTVRILTLADGENVVLKIPFSRYKVLREVRMLQRLRGHLPVPELLSHYLDEAGGGALLLSYLPGLPMTVGITPTAAFNLGQLLARLHSQAMPAFGDEWESSSSASGWWELMDELFYQWFPLCGQVLTAEWLRHSEQLYQQLRSTVLAEFI